VTVNQKYLKMSKGLFGGCASFYGKCGEHNTSFYDRSGNLGGFPDGCVPPELSLFTCHDEVDTRVCNCGPFNPNETCEEAKCNCNKT